MKELNKMTVSELKSICKSESIEGYTKLKKIQLINCIIAHMIDKAIEQGIEKLHMVN